MRMKWHPFAPFFLRLRQHLPDDAIGIGRHGRCREFRMARVHCILSPIQPASELDDLADFMALIAAHGMRLDLPRLIRDRVYARHCLDEARHTPSALVQRCAEQVLVPLC